MRRLTRILRNRRARGWLVSAVSTTLLVALLVESEPSRRGSLLALAPPQAREAVRFGTLVLATALGALAVRSGIGAIFGSSLRQGLVVWRNILSWTLYAVLALLVTSTLGVNISGFLVGGAIVGVVAAVAAQSSLGNFFASMVLLATRPYSVGSWVHLRVWTGTGEYEGIVTDVGTVHTQISDGERVMRIPNSAVITAVLTTGYTPLRAQVDLELPRGAPVAQIEERLRDGLAVGAGGSAVIEPIRYRAGEEGDVLCRLTVRSHNRVPAGRLLEVLDQALQGVRAERSLAS